MNKLTAHREDGTQVLPGDVVNDFRGDQWTFVKATRARGDGRSGKVTVEGDTGRQRDFYDQVFDLEVREATS